MEKIFKEISISKRPIFRLIFFVIADIIVISLSVFLAFIVRFEGPIPARYFLNINGLIIFALIFTLPVFYFFNLYSFSWAYVSTAELISLIKATSLSFLFLTASYFILRDYPLFSGFPRSTLFLSYFFIFILSGGIRFAKRIYLQIFPGRQGEVKEKLRTLIVGAGDAGEQILRVLQISSESKYLPIGFADDNPIKLGVTIHGLKVLGEIKDIPAICRENRIEAMIITLPQGQKSIREAVEIGRMAKVKKIKILPSVTDMISGEASIASLREIDVEDLLGREPVSLDTKLIENFIKGKTILITGAAGSIGSELSKQAAKFQPSLLLLLDQDETGIFNIVNELKEKLPKLKISSLICDVRDAEKINKIFDYFKPTIVFHAAAYKHVPLMEINPDEAVKNNIFGTKVLAEAAFKSGSEKFVFISTDKAVNPTSIMGATKRVGELICQALNKKRKTKFISVRFGNVLDSRGSVIPIFKGQIKSGGPVTVTHPEMRRYFMLNLEACLLVMEAGAMGEGGEVFVLEMGKPIKILDLAKEMIKLSGLEPDKEIPIVFSGIRPGEKLFEEILAAEEGVIPTRYQKILMAKLREPDEIRLEENLKDLKEIVKTMNRERIIEILKGLIPSYAPQKNI